MYLCWIINPHQGFVTWDHGHQVGQSRQAVVGRLGVVLALKGKPKSFVVSTSKNSTGSQNLDPTVLWLIYDFIFEKNDVKIPSKVPNKQKSLKKIR